MTRYLVGRDRIQIGGHLGRRAGAIRIGLSACARVACKRLCGLPILDIIIIIVIRAQLLHHHSSTAAPALVLALIVALILAQYQTL